MANQYDLNQTSTTTTTIKDFEVDSIALETTNENGETYVDFPNAAKYFGYYKQIPELKSAIDNFAIWVAGKGLVADTPKQEITLNGITGWGEDSIISILMNLVVVKKVIGDAFAEIIREDDGTLINLKPISPERMRIVVGENGLIKRYEHKTGKGYVKLRPDQVLHICNDRVGDEIHGTSIVQACKWVIDARNEALRDERMLRHRDLAMGVLYVDTDDNEKQTKIKAQYADAVKNGEVLVLPKDAAKLEKVELSKADRLSWIQYLENFFYQIVKIPRAIVNSSDYTEAASKVGYLTFEPIYTAEQTLLEADLYSQVGVKVKFNRPPSLHGVVSEDEEKNVGQTGFQPSEVQAQAGRVE